MRVLVFHGYLLRGTGSNVYNASLAAALVRLGHDVHLLCQDRHASRLEFVGAVGGWEAGRLEIERLRDSACTVYRPDIGGVLPVYVPDRYEGLEALPFEELSDDQLDTYLNANVDAVRDVVARAHPEVALANHLVMGPAILARALSGTEIPYAVKVHGSALEYTVKPHPRFLPFAREGIGAANGVLVGSRHTAKSLWAALEEPSLPARTRLGPPGVDLETFKPRERDEALAELRKLSERIAHDSRPHEQESDFTRDDAAAAGALADLGRGAAARDRLVAFVGKLIRAKGIDLLLEAWPTVLEEIPTARLVVVGFGEDREAAVAAAGAMGDRVVFTGRLEHDELAQLLPLCEATVVPSVFPEAFGMVAVEAAACGVLPISAGHSGLAEVSRALGEGLPEGVRGVLTFPPGPEAVPSIAARVIEWMRTPADVRDQTRTRLRETAAARYSWETVARGVIAAARGELDVLSAPAR